MQILQLGRSCFLRLWGERENELHHIYPQCHRLCGNGSISFLPVTPSLSLPKSSPHTPTIGFAAAFPRAHGGAPTDPPCGRAAAPLLSTGRAIQASSSQFLNASLPAPICLFSTSPATASLKACGATPSRLWARLYSRLADRLRQARGRPSPPRRWQPPHQTCVAHLCQQNLLYCSFYGEKGK